MVNKKSNLGTKIATFGFVGLLFFIIGFIYGGYEAIEITVESMFEDINKLELDNEMYKELLKTCDEELTNLKNGIS